MRYEYRLLAVGLCLLALRSPSLLLAQENPNMDTPPLQPLFGPTPSPSSVMVITTPNGFDNFNLGTTNSEPHMVSNPLNPAWHFNAFNTKKITGKDVIDFIRWRQLLAEGAPATGATFAEVLGLPKE